MIKGEISFEISPQTVKKVYKIKMSSRTSSQAGVAISRIEVKPLNFGVEMF